MSSSAAAPAYGAADPALSTDDRARFDRAVEARAKGDFAQAWQLASPLFAAYPRVRSVQDLRCKLALEQRFEIDRARKECAPLTEIELGR